MSKLALFLEFALALTSAECNSEGDALYAWKSSLSDPNEMLRNWDPTLVNPCSWFYVSCNLQDSVVRVDLANANLSGPLVPQLGLLANLQFLELYENKISGEIPSALGNLTRLVSLDLHGNKLSGPIPESLANLRSLGFLRLNNNKLSGSIPGGIFQLIQWGSLQILNVSQNSLAGRTPPTKAKETADILIFALKEFPRYFPLKSFNSAFGVLHVSLKPSQSLVRSIPHPCGCLTSKEKISRFLKFVRDLRLRAAINGVCGVGFLNSDAKECMIAHQISKLTMVVEEIIRKRAGGGLRLVRIQYSVEEGGNQQFDRDSFVIKSHEY